MRLTAPCYLLSPYLKSHADLEVSLTGNSGRVSEQHIVLSGFRIHVKITTWNLSEIFGANQHIYVGVCTYICIFKAPNHLLRVVSRFLSRRFHSKSRQLFPFYFSNITLRTDLLTFGVTSAVFKIPGKMHWLLAYFDNPVYCTSKTPFWGPCSCYFQWVTNVFAKLNLESPWRVLAFLTKKGYKSCDQN